MGIDILGFSNAGFESGVILSFLGVLYMRSEWTHVLVLENSTSFALQYLVRICINPYSFPPERNPSRVGFIFLI